MPAIPIIGLGISAFSAYKQAKAQGDAAAAQRDMMQRQSALANEIGGFARQQMSFGQPAMQKAMQHYMTLATGNRGAINAELAPERAGLTDTYRGAEQGMTARMAAGPERDRAIAQLYRQKAGALGVMPFQARSAAFSGLEGLGKFATQQGGELYGKAGTALTGASETGVRASDMTNREYSSYGDLISSGTKAASQVYDWYKNRQSGGMSPTGPYASGYRFPGITPYAG